MYFNIINNVVVYIRKVKKSESKSQLKVDNNA